MARNKLSMDSKAGSNIKYGYNAVVCAASSAATVVKLQTYNKENDIKEYKRRKIMEIDSYGKKFQ